MSEISEKTIVAHEQTLNAMANAVSYKHLTLPKMCKV